MPGGRQTYVAPKNAQPWERQTSESIQAFGAWQTYMTLPKNERSLSRVASDLNRNGSVISGFSSKWGWMDRIAAWEQELDRAKQRGALDEAERAGARQAAHLTAISRVLILPAQELLQRIREEKFDFSHLSDADLYGLTILAARAYPAVARAERLVRGQPTDIVQAPDDEGHAHIPANEKWIAEFYGAAEELGMSVEQMALPPAHDPESNGASE